MSERKASSGEFLDARAFGELLDLNRRSAARIETARRLVGRCTLPRRPLRERHGANSIKPNPAARKAWELMRGKRSKREFLGDEQTSTTATRGLNLVPLAHVRLVRPPECLGNVFLSRFSESSCVRK